MDDFREFIAKLNEDEKIENNVRYVNRGKVMDMLQKLMVPNIVSIRKWGQAVYKNAVDHGFWENATPENKSIIPEKLCLIHSEISEALEGFRNKIPEGEKGCLAEELADATIRIMDLCGYLDIDLEDEIKRKHEINLKRPYKHGKVC